MDTIDKHQMVRNDLSQCIFFQVIEDNYQCPSKETMGIQNASIVSMLLRWLPSLTPPLRKWLVQNLFDLATTAVHNRQQCCTAGILRVIVEVLATSQTEDKYVGQRVESKITIYSY